MPRRAASRLTLPGTALCMALALVAAPAASRASDPDLARAEALIAGGDAIGAQELLDELVAAQPGRGELWLLRSTARFLLGEVDLGRRDLERALVLDPGLRQGWLNLGGLEISEGRYAEAAAALERARALDPAAPDNDLNLGAVRLLEGRTGEAAALFQRYFDANPGSGDAVYLVASNYAMAGHGDAAIDLLGRAIALDERVRLRARTDPNFSDLERRPAFRGLLDTDSYRPPAGALIARQAFDVAYRGGQGRLLPAVLDALQETAVPFDPRIEVTPAWALVWSDLRVRVANGDDGRGEVVLTAPREAFTDAAWSARTGDLLRRVSIQLVRRGGPVPPREPER